MQLKAFVPTNRISARHSLFKPIHHKCFRQPISEALTSKHKHTQRSRYCVSTKKLSSYTAGAKTAFKAPGASQLLLVPARAQHISKNLHPCTLLGGWEKTARSRLTHRYKPQAPIHSTLDDREFLPKTL